RRGGVEAQGGVHVALIGVAGSHTVDGDVVGSGAPADGVEGGVAAEGLDFLSDVGDDAGLQFGELSEVAVEDGEVLDFLAGDGSGAFAGAGLDNGAFGADGHRFG